MQNKIFITIQIEKVKRGDYTDFLDPNEEHQVKSILNKYNIEYETLKLFIDCEKTIIYKDKFPDISLLEIKCDNTLNHKDILGALFSHNISISKSNGIKTASFKCTNSHSITLDDLDNYDEWGTCS